MVGLPMWTIYDHPSDHPGHFVVRSFVVTPQGESDSRITLADSLEHARALVPGGLHCIVRDPSDDPVIVETWL